MRRPIQRSLSRHRHHPHTERPKARPVFAPSLVDTDRLAELVYMELQSETYDSDGAPRIEYGKPSPESVALARVRIDGSALTPTIRHVFIRDLPFNTSFVIEAADGEPGLTIISFGVPVGTLAGATLIYAPSTTLTDISQGATDDILQVGIPDSDIVQMTIELERLETGYLKYRTLGTEVKFAHLSESEIKSAIRALDTELADFVAASMGQVAFEIEPIPEADRALLSADVACTACTRKAVVVVLQIAGLASTFVGGGFALYGTSTDDTVASQVGIALATAGGLFRGIAGLISATAPAPAGGDAAVHPGGA